MKPYKTLALLFILVLSKTIFGKTDIAERMLTQNDTIIFDMSQAEFSTVGNISYIEFPIRIASLDPQINAVDYWFQFDLNKLTYVSTTTLLPILDVFSNFNSNNQFLSNTSSTTSISVYLPLNTNIMKLKFMLNDPCVQIASSDFYTTTTLLNGIVSSYEFIDPDAASQIQLLSINPLCSSSDIDLSYGTTIFGHTIATYDWDFGNSTSATGQNVSANYADSGTYTVTLNITTTDGCSFTLNRDLIIVPSPIIDFSASYDTDLDVVSFTNLSTISSGTITTFTWDFGDSNTSNLFEPTHTYAAQNFYDVTLTATSDLGCTSTASQNINATWIHELREESNLLDIYPNPASNALSVVAIRNMTLFIIDGTGKRVSAEVSIGANQSKTIALDQLADGLYMLVGNYNGHFSQKRFIIQR